jgi:hypothetical protein
VVSTDGGATFVPVAGCHGVTTFAATAQAVVAALYDAQREAGAIVLVRLGEHPTAELVADLFSEEGDPGDCRVLELRVRDEPPARVVEARTASGWIRIRSKAAP